LAPGKDSEATHEQRIPRSVHAWRRGGMLGIWRAHRFLRAFARALRDRATYDVRSNPGLWLGLAAGIPIPVLAVIAAAPPWIVAVSLVAPVGWSVIVGASVRVGMLGADVIQEMRADALDRERVHEEECVDLRSTAEAERGAHERLARLQRLAEEDLALGQIIQGSLVPAGIKRGDLEVALRHIPCTHVGGDYLQASFARSDILYLCVGDVAGHGVAAALVVSRIHGLVQRMIVEDLRPAALLESLNHMAFRLFERTAFFMTFAVLRIDLSARTIEYATAGHPAQLLLRSDGKVEELATGGMALGLGSKASEGIWHANDTAYAPGDALLLFTDGVFEIRAPGGRIWGEESLRSLFVSLSRSAPEVVVAEILREAAHFHGARIFEDDLSLMVARLGVC
jgi:sigma-B regulation protein RsbU (phosphoserine phosphatase)